ncbi:MAG: SGNH/GDSL hydrolase family protein [Candidatus Hydrogenedentota bacterium]
MPNLRVHIESAIWPQTYFSTNSHGFRDDPVAVPKPGGIYRIVCIGGSTTVEGPYNALTYPNLLEEKLRRRFATDKIEVVNAGIYAGHTGTALDRFDDFLALDPDMVVVYNFYNELVRELDTLLEGESPLSWLPAGLQRALNHSYAVRQWCGGWVMPADASLRRVLRESTFQHIEAMRTRCAARGVRLAVCSFAAPDAAGMPACEKAYLDHLHFYASSWPFRVDGYAHAAGLFNEELKAYAHEHDVLYIHVAEQLQGGLQMFIDLCHLHLHGMDLKAKAIARTIQYVQRDAIRERTGG